jgi:DNA integrity scanning protein DisA with diadenylate cyclase activity
MFVSFGIKDAIDITLVAFLMYQIYKLMRSSGTLSIFSGIVAVLVVWLIVYEVLEMRLIGGILDKFISVGFLVLVILFQDDIRRFLVALGSNRGWRFFINFFKRKDISSEEEKYISSVVLACMNLAKRKTGALIVIQRVMDLSVYMQSGEMFRADVNTQLI